MVDALRARRFLETHYRNPIDRLRPVPFSGEWSRAYFFAYQDREYVVRFSPYREDFDKDQAMGEYATDTLPIPMVFEVGQTAGGYYAISQKLPGTPLDALDADGIRTVLPLLLGGLADLQTRDLRPTQVAGLWRPPGTGRPWREELLDVAAPRPRLAGWRERVQQVPAAAQAFDAGLNRLREWAQDLDEHRSLSHNDLLNYNVLVADGRISAVLDWGCATWGDYLYDAAWLLYWWPWYPRWHSVDLREILDRHFARRGGWPSDADVRIRCYLLHIGLDHIAYTAFTQRLDDLRRNTEQVLGYLSSPPELSGG